MLPAFRALTQISDAGRIIWQPQLLLWTLVRGSRARGWRTSHKRWSTLHTRASFSSSFCFELRAFFEKLSSWFFWASPFSFAHTWKLLAGSSKVSSLSFLSLCLLFLMPLFLCISFFHLPSLSFLHLYFIIRTHPSPLLLAHLHIESGRSTHAGWLHHRAYFTLHISKTWQECHKTLIKFAPWTAHHGMACWCCGGGTKTGVWGVGPQDHRPEPLGGASATGLCHTTLFSSFSCVSSHLAPFKSFSSSDACLHQVTVKLVSDQ